MSVKSIANYNYIFTDCTYQYFMQPPTMLDCDPLGTSIALECATDSPGYDNDNVNITFYWTQNVSEAGVSGTAILSGDTSDNYPVETRFDTNYI